MTLIDAAGVISLLTAEPGAAEVAALIRDGNVGMTAVNLGEARDKLERVAGFMGGDVDAAMDELLDAGLSAVAVESVDGLLAGSLRAAEYRPRYSEVSLADCLLLASAINRAARLATSDVVLARIAVRHQVEVIPLPNSLGQRPTLP